MLRVGDHRQLQAVVLAMKAMNRSLAGDIRRDTVKTMGPVWKSLVEQRATTETDSLIIAKGARIAGGNPPKAIAASSRRKLSGGLIPVESWPGYEFGSNRNRQITYNRKNRRAGGTHKVRRHTTRQLPARNAKGRVAFDAFREIGPRLASLWVQTVVKRVHDAAEGRQ